MGDMEYHGTQAGRFVMKPPALGAAYGEIDRESSEIRLDANYVNKRINEFTLASRYWTNYSADKLECMLAHMGIISRSANM